MSSFSTISCRIYEAGGMGKSSMWIGIFRVVSLLSVLCLFITSTSSTLLPREYDDSMEGLIGRRHPRNWIPMKRATPSSQCSPSDFQSASVQLAATELLLGDGLDSAPFPPQFAPAAHDGFGPKIGDAETGEMEEECSQGGDDEEAKEVAPGMPLGQRSLCPFVYVENVDERRLPRKITEVKCLCRRPRRNVASAGGIGCEPLQFDVPVLLFDHQCRQFRRVQQRITLGCVAVYTPTSRTGFLAEIGRVGQPEAIHI